MPVTQTSPLRRCYWLSKFHVERSNDGFWPFFGILGIFPFKDIESFIFNCIATNFICICLRINNENLLKGAIGLQSFTKSGFLTIFGPFLTFLCAFSFKDKESCFSCITTNFKCMCLKINYKNHGTRPLKKCYWFSVSRWAVFYCFWSFFLGNFLAMIAPWRYSPKIFLLILRHMHAKIVARQQKVKNSMSKDWNISKNAREQKLKNRSTWNLENQ